MGYNLQDRMEISVYFSGTEFPLEGINVLNSMQIDMSVKVLLPTLHMVVTDEIELLSKTSLMQDGTPISIVVKAFGSSTSKTYTFRVFKFQSFKATVGTMYVIDGYWDSRQYWLKTTMTGLRGTSNHVLGMIAEECGLAYDGVQTSDEQLWIPQNRTYGLFAKHIVNRGYKSESSLMVAGVDLSGTLIYRDFNEKPESPVNVVLGEYTGQGKTVVDYKPQNNSGFNNLLTGYNNIRISQSMVADNQTINSLAMTSDSRSPFFSMENKDVAARGSVLYSGIDFGNTHQEYERAFYQNQRYKNLLNAAIDLMAIMPTDLGLLEAFNFVDRYEDSGEVNNSWAGVYRLTSKAIRVEGATYTEMFEGYRHGTNLAE